MAFYSYLSTKIIIAFITKSYQDLFGVRSYINAYLYVCDNMVYRECELDFSAIDWEQRRYELAKAAMQGFCSNSHEQVMNASLNMTVEWSLGFADALIKKLKGE